MDFGNLLFVGLVVSQIVKDGHPSSIAVIMGVLSTFLLYLSAFVVMKGA